MTRFVPACTGILAGLLALAAQSADMSKTLRISFNAGETGFDPVRVSDTYSNGVNEQIYEPLLTYDYLARPARLVPLTAAAMPQVTDQGKVWLLKLKKGIHFQADPAFKGRKRELSVDDYVYTFKRMMDPKVRSPWQFLIEKKIAGLDDIAAEAKKSG